jgi:glycerol dehydrogenase-like iron-containing ADH family enzyme
MCVEVRTGFFHFTAVCHSPGFQESHPFFHGEKVAFGVLAQLVLEGKPRSLLNQVLEFASEVGLPMTLADIGLGELSSEMLDRIAARTTAKGETIHNEPFEVHPEMVVDSIRAADAAGRAWRWRHGRTVAIQPKGTNSTE